MNIDPFKAQHTLTCICDGVVADTAGHGRRPLRVFAARHTRGSARLVAAVTRHRDGAADGVSELQDPAVSQQFDDRTCVC